MIRLEDLAIREEAKRFALEELEPFALALPDDAKACATQFAFAREHGYCGLGTSKDLGGKGYNFLQSVLAYEGLAYGDGLFAMLIQLHNNITQMTEQVAVTEELRQVVRQMATGEKISALALTEPSAGSDPGANKGVARKESDGYHITGEKNWVTAGLSADYLLTFVRKEGEKGMYLFLLDRETRGMEISAMQELLLGNGAGEAALRFENCVVPAARMISERGYQMALATIDIARIFVPALCVGVAQRAVDDSIAYLKQRESMGGAIMGKESVQWRLAELDTKIEAARQLVCRAAEGLDAGESITMLAAKAKLFAPAVAQEAVGACMQFRGGRGLYRNEFPARALVCTRMFSVMDGTSEIQKVILGRNLAK